MKKLPAVSVENLHLEVLTEHGSDIGYAVVWTPSPDHNSRIVAEIICGFSESRMRYEISYLKVNLSLRNCGIGEFTLREVEKIIPDEARYVAFTSITSRGTARLVERVFGPLHKFSYHAATQDGTLADFSDVPEESPGRLLRFSRGPSAYVEWKGLNASLKP